MGYLGLILVRYWGRAIASPGRHPGIVVHPAEFLRTTAIEDASAPWPAPRAGRTRRATRYGCTTMATRLTRRILRLRSPQQPGGSTSASPAVCDTCQDGAMPRPGRRRSTSGTFWQNNSASTCLPWGVTASRRTLRGRGLAFAHYRRTTG